MAGQQDEITRTLVVEDEPEQAQLILEEFARMHSSWEVELTRTAAECTARLEQASYDVLLLDYVLPDGDGLDLLGSLRARFPEMLVIVMTAFGDEDVAAEALRAGADDYVSKLGAWVDVLCAATERCLAARAETSQERESLRSCQAMLDHGADLMFMLALDGSMLFIGGPTRELLGYAPEELIGRPPGTHILAPEHIAELKEVAGRLAEAGAGTEHLNVRLLTKDGGDRWFRASLSPHTDAQGNVAGLVGTAQDITEELATARELDRRNSELACLQAVTSTLHAHLDVEEATAAAVAELTEHDLAEGAVVLLANEDATDVDYRVGAGFSAETAAAYKAEADLLSRGVPASCIETGQAAIFGPQEVAERGVHSDLLLAEGLDNALAVPIRIGEQVIGALLVMRRGQPYDQRDADVISIISDQIAMTAATARVHQQVSLGLAGSNQVLEVTLAINAHRDLDEILHSVAEAAAEVGNGVSAAVILLDEAGHDFERMFVAPADEQDAEGAGRPRPDGIAHETLRAGKPLFVTDETETQPQIRQSDLDEGVRSVREVGRLSAARPWRAGRGRSGRATGHGPAARPRAHAHPDHARGPSRTGH
jgi:PAS domain S-box-containing protein